MTMASKYSPSMKDRFPEESLTREANLVVERDRAGVVGAHLEFYSGKPLPEGGVPAPRRAAESRSHALATPPQPPSRPNRDGRRREGHAAGCRTSR